MLERQLEEQVWLRARSRCEYCLFPAEFAESPFHVDHIISRKHDGLAEPGNLALSCFYCNTYKGPNIAGRDPATGDLTRLFHPRQDVWPDHFEWSGPYLFGKTAVGRTTITVLRLNHLDAINLRRLLMHEGMY